MDAIGLMPERTAKARPEPRPLTDARPALPVAEAGGSLWDRAADRRDEIAALLTQAFHSRNVRAWIRKSQPGEYPLVVAVDAWMPVAETGSSTMVEKSSLTVTISVQPYRQSPLIYEVNLKRHAKAFSASRWSLAHDQVSEFVAYLLDGGNRPGFFDPPVALPLRIIGAFIPGVGKEPENEFIDEARPRFWTLPSAIAVVGLAIGGLLALSGLGEEEGGGSQIMLAALIAVASCVAASVVAGRRPIVHSIPRQSVRTPRREFLIDSWHVSVPDAGIEFEAFRQRIYRAATPDDPQIEASREVHQNATPRSFEERERLVLSKGQTTLHVHVYPFGKDAFVGWDNHLNWMRWAEGGTVSSTVKDRRTVQCKAIDVGVHIPTEFDLIEANALSETAHRRVVEEIKAFLKERQIEADLDFKIIRGDRSKALEEGKAPMKTTASAVTRAH
jgi:hypothetical protein